MEMKIDKSNNKSVT